MNRQKQFYPPQIVKNIPQIEFEIVDTRQRPVKTNDIFLSRSAEVVKTDDTMLSNDNDKKLTHVRTFDKDNSIDRFIDKTKPSVKVVVRTLTKTIQASAYLTGFIVVNVVKYSCLFVGAVVTGLVMSVVDICQNHSSGVVEFDDENPVDTCQNQFTINASGNSTVNIQINNK